MFARFPLLSITCGVVVPWTDRQPPLPFLVVAGVACTGAVIAWARHAPAGDIWSVLYGSVLAGVIVAVFFQLVAVIRQLQQTRQSPGTAGAVCHGSSRRPGPRWLTPASRRSSGKTASPSRPKPMPCSAG